MLPELLRQATFVSTGEYDIFTQRFTSFTRCVGHATARLQAGFVRELEYPVRILVSWPMQQ